MQAGRAKHLALSALTRLLGERRARTVLLARNFRSYRRAGVIFVHVPKAAGSTVSAALYGRSLGHFTATELRDHDAAAFAEIPSFAILRDPIARAVSAWRYVRAGGTADGWIAPHRDYALPAFQTLEHFACDWLPERIGRPDLDFVFRPQAEFVYDETGVTLPDRLFSLEDPGPLATFLSGYDVADLTRTARRNQNPGGERDLAALPDRARDALTEIYAGDMALYRATGDRAAEGRSK